jgi:hypothetical protein
VPVRTAELVTVKGRLSATQQRARDDARLQLVKRLSEDLARSNGVPRGWKVPDRMVDRMIRSVSVATVERDYGPVYEATLKADLSPRVKNEVVQAYRHQEVLKRLLVLGGILAFVLVVLSAVSGYIKADEATKGYYTNRLRLAAAAGVAAGGAVLYHLMRS